MFKLRDLEAMHKWLIYLYQIRACGNLLHIDWCDVNLNTDKWREYITTGGKAQSGRAVS